MARGGRGDQPKSREKKTRTVQERGHFSVWKSTNEGRTRVIPEVGNSRSQVSNGVTCLCNEKKRRDTEEEAKRPSSSSPNPLSPKFPISGANQFFHPPPASSLTSPSSHSGKPPRTEITLRQPRRDR
ncbi:hypothetical protein H6P81_015462 [Aristolochia fimbriata]|uniref:Uncharacterized protein n=1 Tax=Aristolochia fimbriata TaxID=158543 RepID=A0AAV7E8Q5_ARIFI|nr:hypothetical protein H6P81_015462 [Aristolochia fimbriata]